MTCEGLPELDRVAPLALVVEAVDAVDRGALVVAAQLVRVRVRVRVRVSVRVRVRVRARARARARIRAQGEPAASAAPVHSGEVWWLLLRVTRSLCGPCSLCSPCTPCSLSTLCSCCTLPRSFR